MKKRFSILRVIGLFLLILAVFVTGSLFINLHIYMADTPRITPYEDVVITHGQVVTYDDIALIEKSHGTRIVGAWWESGGEAGITMSEDSNFFIVTEGEGTILVEIHAQGGDKGEDAREAVAITCK